MARYVRLTAPDVAEIAAAFAALRESLEVSLDFPDEVLADAERSVRAPRLPDHDETAIPFVTIDPPESMDLDQALHLERRGQGYRVRYAIADVAAFVTPGGPMDVEAHKRGQTLYAPDGNARLYPPALSEGAGSLLPERDPPGHPLDDGGGRRPARESRSTSAGRSSAAARSSTTRASSARWTRARPAIR